MVSRSREPDHVERCTRLCFSSDSASKMAAEGQGRSTRPELQLKRRTLQTNVSNVFQNEESDESEDEFPYDKKAKVEDAHSKSKKLKEKGVMLAESER